MMISLGWALHSHLTKYKPCSLLQLDSLSTICQPMFFFSLTILHHPRLWFDVILDFARITNVLHYICVEFSFPVLMLNTNGMTGMIAKCVWDEKTKFVQVADITFSFWNRLAELLYQVNQPVISAMFKPYIARLIIALCRHCQYDATMVSSLCLLVIKHNIHID